MTRAVAAMAPPPAAGPRRRGLRLLQRILLVLLCFCGSPLQARDPVPDLASAELAQAARLLERGDAAAAKALLTARRSPGPQEEAARLWLLAQAHARANEPRAALPHLERLVSAFPADAGLRLALAQTLFAIGDDTRARFHFEQLLGADDAEEARTAAEEFLGRIEARKSWEFDFRLAVAPESNPLRKTAVETVNIGGIDFVLSSEARADPATALLLGAGAIWTPGVTRDFKARLTLSGEARLFEDRSLDDVSLRGEAGLLTFRDGGLQLGGGLAFQSRAAGGDTFSEGPGAFATLERRLAERARIAFRLAFDDLSYPDLPNRDGLRRSAALRLRYLPSARLALDAALFQKRTWAQADFESAWSHGLSAGGTYAWTGGLLTSFSASLSRDVHDAASPLFAEPRAQRLTSVTLGLRHRNLTLGRFVPTFEIGFDRQTANISLYAFDNARASFGLSRAF